MIKLIWAMDRNGLCGKDNQLPWHYKEDLVYFKNNTKNQTVLMGDNTYFSLKGYYKDRPLPFGKQYIASLNYDSIEGTTIVKDIKQFLENNQEDLFVIGGKTIYELSLPYADQLMVTIIDDDHEGNVYFPKVNFDEYKLVSRRDSGKLSFQVYERIR
jgi:dihydrofolate reductase